MSQFKLGNVQPETECKVILKIAFTGQVTKEKTFFIKFPIDIYTSSGSRNCLDVSSSQFLFQLQNDPEKVTKVTSNVKNAKFDEVTKLFSISDKIENDKNERSIIITFETNEPIQSSCLISPTDSVNYDGCAMCISPKLPSSESTNSEFVFVVDCSGSMSGNSIQKASECLEFFVKSLPADSYFNVVRFGSSYEKLFENSVQYDDQTSEKAVELAKNLSANLGGTNIYTPLENIYSEECKNGQRQIFIMTDGEVNDVESVLDLISTNSNENRCFTIGIGRGCDAGLVEGMANASGGISDFVQEGDSISEKVIPQLQSSLHPSVTSVEIHIENNDSFEVSPYPLPSINANGSTVVYLRQKKKENAFEGGIMITGTYGKETVEIPIDDIQKLVNVEEDKFGCSGGKNIGKAIVPLFAFSHLQKLDRKRNISDDDKMKAIELSISSGVLCKYTGYVGMTEQPVRYDSEPRMMRCSRHYCGCSAAPMKCCCKAKKCCKKMCYGSCSSSSRRAAAPKPESIECCFAAAPKRCYEQESRDYQRKEEVAQSLPTNYDLVSLINFQKAAGFWDNLDAIKSMTGAKVDKIDEISLPDKDDERKCLATILAIAAMRAKSAGDKNSWAMIEQKALSWLKKKLPDIDIEKVISNIQALVK